LNATVFGSLSVNSYASFERNTPRFQKASVYFQPEMSLVHIKKKRFKHRKGTIVALTLASHNLPTDRARELFKSSTELVGLPASIKKREVLDLSFLWVTSQKE